MYSFLKNRFSRQLFQLFVGVIPFLLYATKSQAQLTDTSTAIKNTFVEVPKSIVKIKSHSPRKASLFSLVLPGAGQVYNKKYWKLPIIYGGFVGLAYSFNLNQTKYINYRTDYINSLSGTYDGKYSAGQLLTLQRYYHRYRDLSVIGAAFLYILNIVDASVDAHMLTFSVSDDLSLHVYPVFINTLYSNSYTKGVSLLIKF